MESTISFTGIRDYQCKQLNFVSISDKCIVEYDSSNNVTGLAVKDESLLNLDIPKKDEDFIFSIKELSFVEELIKGTHQNSQKVTGYLEFGYPHSICGLVFMIDPDSTSGELKIVKANNTVEVFFKDVKITEKSNIVGPLLSLHLKNNIEDPNYYKFIVNDISYNTQEWSIYGYLYFY